MTSKFEKFKGESEGEKRIYPSASCPLKVSILQYKTLMQSINMSRLHRERFKEKDQLKHVY
jgi:hypothetical protein